MNHAYTATQLTRADIDQISGSVVLEFGIDWCGHCQAAQPLITAALADYPHIQHIKIEDGKGRRLGRSFGVKLWPTLIFLNNGLEISRLIRPINVGLIENTLREIRD